MSSQLEDALNEAVERRTAELRAALEFYANADNYVGGEVGWWADAPGGEHRWCMDFGSIARSALVSPDRPPFFTEQQERALARCEGYDEARAASPDERLREAGERLAQAVARVCGEGHPALAAWRALPGCCDRPEPEPRNATEIPCECENPNRIAYGGRDGELHCEQCDGVVRPVPEGDTTDPTASA